MNLIDRYEILTPSGFKDFKAIKRTTSSLLISLKTSKGREIKGSPDHRIKLFKKKSFTLFCDLTSGDKLSKDETIESIDYISGHFPLFTIQGVEGEEYLIEKDIVTKNCAFIPEGIFDEFWSSVIPTISSGTETKIIVVSTSNGLNHYYTLWNDALEGKNGFAPFRVDWWDVPGRDEAWAAQMRVSVKKFEQEFGNEFFGRATSVIPTPLLKSLMFKQPISSNPEMKIFELPQKGRAYLGVVDVSEGVGGDYSVLTIFRMPQNEEEPFEIVFTFRSNTIDVFRFTEIVHTFSQKFNEAYLLIEVNVMNIAESLYRDYEVENILKTTISKQKMTTTFFSGGSKLGVKTTEVIKKIGLEKLIQIFEDKKLIVNDFSYIEELSTLQKDKKTFKAKSGSNDDTSMTLILFGWLTTQEGFKELFGMEDFKKKLNNEYLESVYNSLPEFFIEDGINQNF